MLEHRTIVAINRQYGSGGREIGTKVAQELGIAYYDKELIARAVKESGIAEEFFEENSEQIRNPMAFLFSFPAGGGGEDSLPVSDRVFLAQSRIVRDAADEGSCVIIGHCADYVLEDRDDVVTVFIHGDWQTRVQRVAARNSLTEAEAVARIKRIDKERETHYQHYTDRKWGRVTDYDLTLDSSRLGVDGSVALILDYLRRLEAAQAQA